MNSSLSDVALVVLNYNSAHDTLYCVEKLLSFGSDFHIIVVDNMSPDGSFDEIKEKLGGSEQVDVIQSDRNGGYSYGNNFGMRYAVEHYGSTVLGILNPDVIIPRLDVISVMKEQLESDPTFAVIGGAMIEADYTYDPYRSGFDLPTKSNVVWLQFVRQKKRLQKKRMPMVGEKLAQVDCISGCFLMIKATVLQEIGFLDEHVFMYREEEILGCQMKRLGYKEVIAYDQFYIHNHRIIKHKRVPFKKKLYLTKREYKSHQYLVRTYYSPSLLPLLWCVEMLNRIYLACAWVANHFFKEQSYTRKVDSQ